MKKFRIHAKFKPSGDQPQAIDDLVKGLEQGKKHQTLLGVTGSGKTFTIANVVEKMQRPALVISHNKTLAAQLCQEFRDFFPENAVEYFVSYYDYYQPEAYIPHTDTYIEKDSAINDEIDRLRHSATMSILTRRDVIIVASVSCIYGLGTPKNYQEAAIKIRAGEALDRDELLRKLVAVKYERNDLVLERGKFRIRGNVFEILPTYEKNPLRFIFGDDGVEKIEELEHITGKVLEKKDEVWIFPGTHYVTSRDGMEAALASIEQELKDRIAFLKQNDKKIEAYRLEKKTRYDMEMIRELGYCKGIENYSRHFDGRQVGQPPGVLLDFFPDDFLLFMDESHVGLPQLHSMYAGDRARKDNLINYGFRLPSAYDNRPLKFEEFEKKIGQCVYVSATPGKYEIEKSKTVVEQIIRPTGLVDPALLIRPTKGQIEDILKEVRKVADKKERVLITTLTKRMAEDLSEYLSEKEVRVRFLHSDIDTLDRVDILRGLRKGDFDVLVGVNLLREGLDLPEVSLVIVMDADKEGFLRAENSLIQTIGRAARNANGKVIMYANQMTGSMQRAISETNRRRNIQLAYNKKHKIKPQTIIKEVHDISQAIQKQKDIEIQKLKKFVPKQEVPDLIKQLEEEMQVASTALEFEKAAQIRDKIKEIKKAFKLKNHSESLDIRD